MHMSDSLISPAVGCTMVAVTAGVIGCSIKKIKKESMDEKKVPLMGVMGAFVFAAQMINFTIPGTGSSGHIAGALLLAILLGPEAAFLAMSSILIIQCLFFADGGLLALGCNIFNMGFYGCFIAYPLIYKKIINNKYSVKRIWSASIISTVIALQLGAFSVVIETLLSGKTELPFTTFLLLMQPIHFAIAIGEGIVTAAIISFVYKTRPDILRNASIKENNKFSHKKVIAILFALAVLVGGMLSWFASKNPDGLEWSISNIVGTTELEVDNNIHRQLGELQEKIAILPDYNFKQDEAEEETEDKIINVGTSTAGITGSLITLIICVVIGVLINRLKRFKLINCKSK